MDEYVQLTLWEPYEPQVNDYVVWNKIGNEKNDEGWVYFKDEEYITIETGVKPKPPCAVSNSRHKYIHTLLLCPHQFWGQLKYVKSREK